MRICLCRNFHEILILIRSGLQNNPKILNRPSIHPTKTHFTNPMPKILRPLTPLILFLLLLPPPTLTLPTTTTLQNLISLTHSLTTRIATLRSARGDLAGAHRARLIAAKLHRLQGVGVWRLVGSVGWDYVRNYAWREVSYGEVFGTVSDLNELLSWIGEFGNLGSDGERVAWVTRNYGNLLKLLKSVFTRLLNVFHKSGALRDLVETVQREVIEGNLVRDCLELGSNDLKGLLQIFKDFALQFSSNAQDNYTNRNEL